MGHTSKEYTYLKIDGTLLAARRAEIGDEEPSQTVGFDCPLSLILKQTAIMSGDIAPPREGNLSHKNELVVNEEEEEKIPEASGDVDDAAEEEAREKTRREREARAQALTLEIVGDLPYAEVKPPENVLFVCKLNPVTEGWVLTSKVFVGQCTNRRSTTGDDLDTIFSRFGPIISCEVIRDKRTRDSLQYAFIEFEHQEDCEQAYFKMQGVLIDDHRIHVDFSQSVINSFLVSSHSVDSASQVSRLSDKWRTATNSKRAQNGGGFGGISSLEKKRQFRAAEHKGDEERKRYNGYGMVFDKESVHDEEARSPHQRRNTHRYSRSRSRSRSPKRREYRNERKSTRDHRWRRSRSRDFRREGYEERRRSR